MIRDKDYCWDIDFWITSSRHSILDLTLNDSIQAKLLMDTGWRSFVLNDTIITPELWFMLPDSTDIVYTHLLKQQTHIDLMRTFKDRQGEPLQVLVYRNLKINDSPPMKALAFVDIDKYYNDHQFTGVSGLVNRSLWLRHRQVLYDPFAGKMIFYKSPEDVVPYSDENTNVILNLIPNNGRQQD